MTRLTLLCTTAAAVGALASAAAAQETVHMIQCGDAIADGYPDFISQWEEQNPDYKVEVELVGWAQCQDKATTLAIAGDPVALAYMGSRVLKQLAQNDLIVPVPMTEEEQASYYPHIVDTVTFDGEQWGIPVAFSTKALFWNKGLFEEAGLDPETPPATWDEMYEDAKAVTDNTDARGFGLVAKTFDNTMHQFMHWVYTNDGSVIDADGNITMDSPQVLEALEAVKKMVPVSEEGPTAYEQNELIDLFNDGKIAMIEQGPWMRNRINDGIEWGVAPLPLGPSAQGPGTLLITDSLAVFQGSGVEDAAISLAKFLTNPENQFYYEKTQGLTPLRPVPGVEEIVAEDPTWQPFLDGISNGGPEPLFTEYKEFQDAIIAMVQSVVTGEAEPQAALTKAAAEIEDAK